MLPIDNNKLFMIKRDLPADDYMRLREVAGLTPRSRKAVEKGLSGSLHIIRVEQNMKTVAMGRIVGDGGLNFEIVDVAVDPKHQGKGFGKMVMNDLMNYLANNAPPGAVVTLMADVPEFYEPYGFKLTRPKSEGMIKMME